LEVLGRVATVAVDKTGTLTDNRLAVIGVATGVGVARGAGVGGCGRVEERGGHSLARACVPRVCRRLLRCGARGVAW